MTKPRVLGPNDGEIIGTPGEPTDRIMITTEETGGRFSVVEHYLPPRALAAPLHIHTDEDEYSFVLEGRLGALLGDEEVFGEVGDLVFKPRGQWHTFWNASDEPTRILELISPGGLEKLFRELGEMGAEPDPEAMAELAGRFGAKVDFEKTFPIVEKHGLAF
ncbi:MAG: cupin domain-containing protein [Actinomycetota bacterium]